MSMAQNAFGHRALRVSRFPYFFRGEPVILRDRLVIHASGTMVATEPLSPGSGDGLSDCIDGA